MIGVPSREVRTTSQAVASSYTTSSSSTDVGGGDCQRMRAISAIHFTSAVNFFSQNVLSLSLNWLTIGLNWSARIEPVPWMTHQALHAVGDVLVRGRLARAQRRGSTAGRGLLVGVQLGLHVRHHGRHLRVRADRARPRRWRAWPSPWSTSFWIVDSRSLTLVVSTGCTTLLISSERQLTAGLLGHGGDHCVRPPGRAPAASGRLRDGCSPGGRRHYARGRALDQAGHLRSEQRRGDPGLHRRPRGPPSGG